ncbi:MULTISPECIES: RNA 2',3'-cyclic phosphodiesterase [Clostridia]|uniref:RNA 2',3'-cyclic phosphodiesterase n=1 Tax=Clostridia TaxID=186801 RepID=UPI001314C698|nr:MULTISPECIES: RNA 2',3'-cyclic phosphodiesterase [Clostridia]
MLQQPHYFIAIPLSKEMQSACRKEQAILRSKLPYKQWVHELDFHITLKFLGPVSDSKVWELVKKLQTISFSPFYVQVGGIGTFGSTDKPRVIYSAVQSTEALTDLAKQVQFVAVQEGFSSEERPYIPHITLAKKWAGTGSMEKEIAQTKRMNHSINRLYVDRFVLYQIFPKEQPKYNVKACFKALGGENTGAID